ncbi:MAG TPA: DNA gyrase subunit A [Candidatus Nanoarchaeia archaeon]|nr:DNA gyrase subunit A [Candidatus Nanoarchaeia archaeon]
MEDDTDPPEQPPHDDEEHTKQAEPFPVPKNRIITQLIEEETKRAYLDYAMSVIVGRALPDIRDGLKPVHRRILFAMHELGILHNKPYKKCARIVGEVLGKYHPHGDTAVYDALVRMAQSFSLRYPLIQGQGNFGSIDGDNPAAMRYTESRLTVLAEQMLADIDKETVAFVPNFDDSLQEPSVLPSKLPNLLINGSSGIAVGMATNIPPHNLREVCDALTAFIDHPDITIPELMRILPGPDFPTGGIITGSKGLLQAYSTGRGKIINRAQTTVEEGALIITEIPYQVNKSQLIEQIAQLVRSKTITGISDIRDESDRRGMRIVIETKRDADPDVVLNQLFLHTRLQSTFGINLVALVNNEPKTLTLRQIISLFITHRKEVVVKRTRYNLTKAEERAHLLQGLLIALQHIDEVIALIRGSANPDIAKSGLTGRFSLTPVQAQAILDMRLQRLTSLEQEKTREEHASLLVQIADLRDILASEARIMQIIKDELAELKSAYGDGRKTAIQDGDSEEMRAEDLVADEPVAVTITHSGYIKRTSLTEYHQQRRGGKGVIAATTKEGDFVKSLMIANTHDTILCFTDRGQLHWLRVYEIPDASRQSKGKAIVNLLGTQERITALVRVQGFRSGYLFMATKQGVVKKTGADLFANPRKGGIRAITMAEGDELIDVQLITDDAHILLATRQGNAVRFAASSIRPIGRSGQGVRGIRLRKDDELIGMVVTHPNKTLFTITAHGYGKRTPVEEYRLIRRGGSGVRNIICSERNGPVVAVVSVQDGDDVMVVSKNGVIIRVPVSGISVIGRNTQGVRIIKLEKGDIVVSAARVMGDIASAQDPSSPPPPEQPL